MAEWRNPVNTEYDQAKLSVSFLYFHNKSSQQPNIHEGYSLDVVITAISLLKFQSRDQTSNSVTGVEGGRIGLIIQSLN